MFKWLNPDRKKAGAEAGSEPAAGGAEPKAVSSSDGAPNPAAGILLKAALLALLAGVGAWAAGVRVNPAALRPASQAAAPAKPDFVLELKNGQSVVGKVVREENDRVIFFMEGSEVTFQRGEIADLRPATAAESALDASKGAPARPIFTFDPQKGLWKTLKKLKKP